MEHTKFKNFLVKNLGATALFSLVMAYVESAAVVYLRRINGSETFTINPGPFDPHIAAIEVGRELSTLLMLFIVGWMAGKNFQSRLGFFLFTFGIWDIFYYVWLRIIADWPESIIDTDLLFLIPLPWWGPVLSPILIAALMSVTGVRMVILDNQDKKVQINACKGVALVAGILLVLYAFMADAIANLPANKQVLSQLQPNPFNWPVFLLGLGLEIYASWTILFLKRNP